MIINQDTKGFARFSKIQLRFNQWEQMDTSLWLQYNQDSLVNLVPSKGNFLLLEHSLGLVWGLSKYPTFTVTGDNKRTSRECPCRHFAWSVELHAMMKHRRKETFMAKYCNSAWVMRYAQKSEKLWDASHPKYLSWISWNALSYVMRSMVWRVTPGSHLACVMTKTIKML